MLSEKSWRTDAVVELILYLFVCMGVGSLLIYVIAPQLQGASSFKRLGIFVVGTVSFHGAAFVLLWRLIKKHQTSWGQAFGLRGPGRWKAILLGILAGILVLPLSVGLQRISAELMTLLRLQPVVEPAVETLQTSQLLAQKIYFAIVAVVVAPAIEEMLFRGVIYPWIKQRGHPQVALWGTSLAFAAIHSNLMVFVPLTVLSMILIWLYERTDSLWAPMLTHSTFNTLNLITLLLGSSTLN